MLRAKTTFFLFLFFLSNGLTSSLKAGEETKFSIKNTFREKIEGQVVYPDQNTPQDDRLPVFQLLAQGIPPRPDKDCAGTLEERVFQQEKRGEERQRRLLEKAEAAVAAISLLAEEEEEEEEEERRRAARPASPAVQLTESEIALLEEDEKRLLEKNSPPSPKKKGGKKGKNDLPKGLRLLTQRERGKAATIETLQTYVDEQTALVTQYEKIQKQKTLPKNTVDLLRQVKENIRRAQHSITAKRKAQENAVKGEEKTTERKAGLAAKTTATQLEVDRRIFNDAEQRDAELAERALNLRKVMKANPNRTFNANGVEISSLHLSLGSFLEKYSNYFAACEGVTEYTFSFLPNPHVPERDIIGINTTVTIKKIPSLNPTTESFFNIFPEKNLSQIVSSLLTLDDTEASNLELPALVLIALIVQCDVEETDSNAAFKKLTVLLSGREESDLNSMKTLISTAEDFCKRYALTTTPEMRDTLLTFIKTQQGRLLEALQSKKEKPTEQSGTDDQDLFRTLRGKHKGSETEPRVKSFLDEVDRVLCLKDETIETLHFKDESGKEQTLTFSKKPKPNQNSNIFKSLGALLILLEDEDYEKLIAFFETIKKALETESSKESSTESEKLIVEYIFKVLFKNHTALLQDLRTYSLATGTNFLQVVIASIAAIIKDFDFSRTNK